MKNIISFTLSFLCFGLLACTKPTNQTETPTAETQATSGSKTVNLAIWGAYITPEILAEFEKETGLKVTESNYTSNEELLAKLQAGASGYDVAVPSDYMVKVMAELKLLQTLDVAKIANAQKIDPAMRGRAFDPDNSYSLPLSWGTTGIAYNTKSIKTPIKGWKDLFENKALTGKFTFLDDVRETLGAALKREALSLNSTNSADLAKAKTTLIGAKKRLKSFNSEVLDGLVAGEMAVAHAFSCDALQAQMKTQGAIQYILPEEGFTLWIDNLVIPQGAQNVEGAHKLINFLLSAKVGADRAQRLFSAPTNIESIALLPKEIRDNKALFPEPETLKRAEMMQDLGDAITEWDRIWTEVKAAK